MKPGTLFRVALVMVVVFLVLDLAAPLGYGQELKSCKEGLDDCLRVAAVLGAFYYIYCFEGYAFCKKYIEKR